MAGPWFTVQAEYDDWQLIDTIWLSDGAHNDVGRVEMRVRLARDNAQTSSHASKETHP